MASHHQTVATVPLELLDVIRAARMLLGNLDGLDPSQTFLLPDRETLSSALAKLDALP